MFQRPRPSRHLALIALGLGLPACSGDDAGRATDTTGSASLTASATATTSSSSTADSATESDSDATTSGGASDSATTSGSSTSGESDTEAPLTCGDGQLDAGEQCDDGAANGVGEPCNPDCTLNVCGDGVLSVDEECDEGDANGPDGECSETCTNNPNACGESSAEATLSVSPVDIIIVIDNSGSMGNEIDGVELNINTNFASIIEKSGLDYRVIMVARHGQGTSICVEAPLSGIPQGGCVNPPTQPVFNPGKFYHYSVGIGSHNAWCQLLATFNGNTPDQFNLAPGGWQQWLREDAVKTFIAISDDGSSCGPYNDGNNVNSGVNAANAFDAALLALSPLHFGTAEERNYFFYSIIGMAFNNPKTQPYTPQDPIVTAKCNTAADAGTGHQALSVLTDSLRFPLCDTSDYSVVFQAIADGVIKGAKVACEFEVPEPPMGENLNYESIKVEYTPMGMGEPLIFDQVLGPDQCGPGKFYVDIDTVILCPEACAEVQKDKDAKILVKFTCDPIDPG
jgi:hypothetical protein